MLEHSKIVAADHFHYSSHPPLENLDRIIPWANLGGSFSLPVDIDAYGLLDDSSGTRILLQSIGGNDEILTIESTTDAINDVVFEFEMTSAHLPATADANNYCSVTCQTKTRLMNLFFTQTGVLYGDGALPTGSIESTVEYLSGRRRWRVMIDDTTGAYSVWVYTGHAWLQLLEHTALLNLDVSYLELACKGSASTPVVLYFWEYRLYSAAADPVFPEAVIESDEMTHVGVVTELDGSTSLGVVDYVWKFTPATESETEIAEESYSKLVFVTPGLDVVTFMISGLGIEGDRYVLNIVDAALSITLDDEVITLSYPAGTTFDALQTALLIAGDPAHNPAVSALMKANSVGGANDLPAPAVAPGDFYRFDGGRTSTAADAVFTPDSTGVYLASLSVRSNSGLWNTDTYAIGVSPLNSVFGSVPDVSLLRRQIGGWWMDIENRKQIEAAWGGSGQMAASDLLDILQTRMTRVFDNIPDFWRKRWYGLQMHHEFSASSDVVATQHTAYGLRGIVVPTDDYDDDATSTTMVPQSITYNYPVNLDGMGAQRYLTLPTGGSWNDLSEITLGVIVTIAGSVLQVTSADANMVTCSVITDGGVLGDFATFSVTSVASGSVSGTERLFLADITVSSSTELSCPQDTVPSRDLVDAGSNYGYVFDTATNKIRLAHGLFSSDAQPGDYFVINGSPRNIVAVTANEVELSDLPYDTPSYPSGYFSWSIWRPVAWFLWESVGYVHLPDVDEVYNVGDLLMLHARGFGQVDKVAVTIHYIDAVNHRFYFSLNDLYKGLLVTRSAWGSLDLTCSAIMRTNYLPLPEHTHFVPVIRTTLLVDTPALMLNEDFQVTDGAVILDTPYDTDNTPPASLWAENMLLYNWYASETWGALTGITIDEVSDPETYVPLVRSIYDQRMFGPWKFMMERAAAGIMGLPFAVDGGLVTEQGDGWFNVAGLNKGGRVYHTDYPRDMRVLDPDTGLYSAELFVGEFQSLDSRLQIMDRVDDSILFDTYKTAKMAEGHADWWHDFLVVVQHTAATATSPWSTLVEYVRDSKPIWTDFKAAVKFEFEEQIEVLDELTLKYKRFFFDVPTAVVYPDSPLVMGSAHMFDDPVFGPDGPDFEFVADGGSNTTVTRAATDFTALGARRGCIVLNKTQGAFGWVTHVEVGTIHVEYGMRDHATPPNDTIVNVNTDEIRVVDGGFRWGLPFDIPLRGVAGPATNANQIEFIPFTGSVDYKGDPVTKDLRYYAADLGQHNIRGWTVRNRTVAPGVPPYPEDTVVDEIGPDLAQLTTGIPGQAPGDIIEWEPPTGVGAHIFGDPEIRGPMAHPYMMVSSFNDAIPGAYAFPAITPPWLTTNPLKLFDEMRPDPPFDTGVLPGDPIIPIVRNMTPLGSAPLVAVEVLGHYFAGVVAPNVTLGGVPVIGLIVTGDWKLNFLVPALGSGFHDLVVTDPNGSTTYEYPFVIP